MHKNDKSKKKNKKTGKNSQDSVVVVDRDDDNYDDRDYDRDDKNDKEPWGSNRKDKGDDNKNSDKTFAPYPNGQGGSDGDSDGSDPTEIDDPEEGTYDGGIFNITDPDGIVRLDFLYDGGLYEGEVAFVSAKGLGSYVPGTTRFTREVARRALSGRPEEGRIVITDPLEGAHFNGDLGERGNHNHGEYQGVKEFQMEPGGEYFIMLVPNGTVQEVFDNPGIRGNKRPLYSMTSANPNEVLQVGQIADVTGDGHTFTMEDVRVDYQGSDRDYNDFIFQVHGAIARTVNLDEVINPERDWRKNTEVGRALVEYANFSVNLTNGYLDEEEVEKDLSSAQEAAIDQAQNLDVYDPEVLAGTTQWVISLPPQLNAEEFATLLEAEYIGIGNLDNTYIWEFPEDVSAEEIQTKLADLVGSEFAYPLAPVTLYAPSFIPEENNIEEREEGETPWHLQSTNESQVGTNVDSISEIATGEGVTIAIIDDGVDWQHQALQDNYLPEISEEFNETLQENSDNSGSGLPDTEPPEDASLEELWYWGYSSYWGWGWANDQTPENPEEFQHGTAVTGVILADANLSLPGSTDEEGSAEGVAPDAQFVSLQLTSSVIDEKNIVEALTWYNQDIDIYNNSWKPGDDQVSMGAVLDALEDGVNDGRGGLGSIFIFAAGNDGWAGSNVNHNSFANSRFSIAVGAVDDQGQQSWYSEPGAPLVVSAPSSASYEDEDGNKLLGIGITTTDLSGDSGYDRLGSYTNTFGGTSAAAAIVSGVVALMLEVNPNLNWRDIQQILIQTAQQNDSEDEDWAVNGGGYEINHKYGFGVVDAAEAVSVARDWQTMAPLAPMVSGFGQGQELTDYNMEGFLTQEITDLLEKNPADFTEADAQYILNAKAEVPGVEAESKLTIAEERTVEWVEVIFDSEYSYRGDLTITLVSPQGTESVLTEWNPTPSEYDGAWTYTSVRHWGESSKGEWTLRVADEWDNEFGTWDSWRLNIYGTDQSNISLDARDASITEDGDAAAFVVSREGGNLNTPLTVNYSVAGSAANGTDYQYLPGSVEIPAGESSATISVIPFYDLDSEGLENVTLHLEDADSYRVSDRNGATVSIQDSEVEASYGPFVYVNPEGRIYRLTQLDTWLGAQAQAEALGGNLVTISNPEEQDWLLETFGDFEDNQTQQFFIGLTDSQIYTNGSQLEWIGSQIDKEEIDYSLWLEDTTQNNPNPNPPTTEDEDIPEITLADIVGELSSTWIRAQDSNITDLGYGIIEIDPQEIDPNSIDPNEPTFIDKKAIANITVTDYQADETGNAGQFVVSRTGSLAEELTINFSVGGSALPGEDYRELLPETPGTIVIPAGVAQKTISIVPVADLLLDEDEEVIIKLAPGTNYEIGTQAIAQVAIANSDPATSDPFEVFWQTPTNVIADSVSEFSNSQGQDNWEYGYYVGDVSSYDSDSFEPLTYTNTGELSFENLPAEDLTIRRWTSEVDGEISFSGNRPTTDVNGNEIITSIWIDGERVWSSDIVPGETTYDISEQVQAGSIVDFVLDSSGDELSDLSQFRATISQEANKAQGYFLTALDTALGAQVQAEAQDGNLVTIDNYIEERWLTETFTGENFWIGLTDSPLYGASEGNYQWVGGNSDYLNWDSTSQPGNVLHTPEGEDFVVKAEQWWYDTSNDPRTQGDVLYRGIVETSAQTIALNLNQILDYTEDLPLEIQDIAVADYSGEATVKLTLNNSEAGILTEISDNSPSANYNNNNGVWEVTGDLEELNNLLAQIKFVPDANFNNDTTIAVEIIGTETQTGVIQLNGNATDDPLTVVNNIVNFSGATQYLPYSEYQPLEITYEELLAGTEAEDIDDDEIYFEIAEVTSGILMKNGREHSASAPIALTKGESVSWTPTTHSETLPAFTVNATDGTTKRLVMVTADVADPTSGYLSFNDSPFSPLVDAQSFDYFYREDFEDAALNTPGVNVSTGSLREPNPTYGDSVDGDDGAIDGLGLNGYSWFMSRTQPSVTFAFDQDVLGSHPTHAGIVWTDGNGSVTFEAFDSQGASLGNFGPATVGDGNARGGTQEDRFFGISHADGISAISISMDAGSSWEVDHLQYGWVDSADIPSEFLIGDLATPVDAYQPVVAIDTTDPANIRDAIEGEQTGLVTLTRTGPLDKPLTVFYEVGGNAIPGEDYVGKDNKPLTGYLTFEANSDSATIDITAIDDEEFTGEPTVTVTIKDMDGYQVGPQETATVQLIEDELEFYVVTNTNDSGEGSLRAAIEWANEQSGPEAKTIKFNIPVPSLISQEEDPEGVGTPPSGGATGNPTNEIDDEGNELLDINYNPETGTFAIQLQSALPKITRPVEIDGNSQRDYINELVEAIKLEEEAKALELEQAEVSAGLGSGLGGSAVLSTTQSNNSTASTTPNTAPPVDTTPAPSPLDNLVIPETPIIELDGSNAGAEVSGLTITGGGSTVQALTINRFSNHGIFLEGGSGNTISDNYIGTDVTGSEDLGNSWSGIEIQNSGDNTIAGNLLSGNDLNGLMIVGRDSSGNEVIGNKIGTDASGTLSLANGKDGLRISEASDNIVGAKTELDGNIVSDETTRNLISGNNLNGITIVSQTSTDNKILGNYIGTDVSGILALGNRFEGIEIDNAPQNIIGGTAPGERNVISGNEHNGVEIKGQNAEENEVTGNYIGTDYTGTVALGNIFDGVKILDAANNTIGGTTAEDRNLISGNKNNGIEIEGPLARLNQVINNYIGTDISGTEDLGNLYEGIKIVGGSENTIGGLSPAIPPNPPSQGGQVDPTEPELYRNLISGNKRQGILILGIGARENRVIGNYVGTDLTGQLDLGNRLAGIAIENAPANEIGGTEAGAFNLISGNDGQGILILGNQARENAILANLIGTNLEGTAALGNSEAGIEIDDAPENAIGGTAPALDPDTESKSLGNLIAANSGEGILIKNIGADTNKIFGNYIGTDISGVLPLGNALQGIKIYNAPNNKVGGTSEQGDQEAPNLISANGREGVVLIGIEATGNEIQNNFIGTDLEGILNLGNGWEGVKTTSDASNNLIGGTDPDVGNTIAFNGYVFGADGVLLASGTGNALLGNNIFGNEQAGIDLSHNFGSANDEGDLDEGPNNLQNFPVLTYAKASGSGTTIEGFLNSSPNTAFRIEFFSNSNNGNQAENFFGFQSVTTDAQGNVNFEAFVPDITLTEDLKVTATATELPTATNQGNNTSELSSAIEVVPNTPPTLGAIAPIVEEFDPVTGEFLEQSLKISYDDLTGPEEILEGDLAIAYDDLINPDNPADEENDPISFLISAVAAGGSLTQDGEPVIPGETLLSEGAQLLWTPETGTLADLNVTAFQVQAFDGADLSTDPVPVQISFEPSVTALA